MSDDEVQGLAEYFAAQIGLEWHHLTPKQQDNYCEIAREKIAQRAATTDN